MVLNWQHALYQTFWLQKTKSQMEVFDGDKKLLQKSH